MGIVMAIVMLAGLTMMLKKNRSLIASNIVALLLLLGGFWNALWYGLRHLGQFWGAAGLVTGFVMVVTALYLWLNKSSKGSNIRTDYKIVVTSALAASFLLYFITLVQLNLGYEIIR